MRSTKTTAATSADVKQADVDGTREKVDEEESKAIRASSAELGIESMPTNWSCECGQENPAIFISCRKCGKGKSNEDGERISQE